MDDLEHVSCGVCGERFDPPAPDACHKCGSQAKHLNLTLHDEVVGPRDTIQASLKDPSRPKKKRLRYQFFDGAELRISEGDFVHKERIIDVDGDRYKEFVVTDGGEVLVDVEHSLRRDHQGHGSAKFKALPAADEEGKG